MFGEMPEHIRKRKTPAEDVRLAAPVINPAHGRPLPYPPLQAGSYSNAGDLNSLDSIVLPSSMPIDGVVLEPLRLDVKEAVLDNSAKLEGITNKALTRLDEFLSEPITGDPKADAIIMDGVRLALTTQLRVDDSRLKKRSVDTLANLIERMNLESAKLPATVRA